MNDREIHLGVLEHAFALLLAEAARFEAAGSAERAAHGYNLAELIGDLHWLGRGLHVRMPPLGTCLELRRSYLNVRDDAELSEVELAMAGPPWSYGWHEKDWTKRHQIEKPIGTVPFDELAAKAMQEPMESARYWAGTLPELGR